jgi:hypothetical protein
MTNRKRGILQTGFSREQGPLKPGDSLGYGDLLDPFGKSCVQPTRQEQRRKVFVLIHPPVIGLCVLNMRFVRVRAPIQDLTSTSLAAPY